MTSVKKSFTLIELMVTVGILAITLTLTSGILISIVKSYQKQYQIQKITRNGDLAVKMITEKIRRSTSVTAIDSGQGLKMITVVNNNPVIENIGQKTPSGSCGFVYLVGDINPVSGTIGNESKITDDTNSTGVNISETQFTVVFNGSNSYVDVTLKVTPCGNQTPSRVFNTTVTLRGTY